MSNLSRDKHINQQSDAALFRQLSSNKAIDLLIFNAIQNGEDRLEHLASKFRIPADRIADSITKSLFHVQNGHIKVTI